ncbi:MAG: GNAT family N-acetyltransferase [Acidimicrobiia bacterium]|nr:GNAT family N-acetyltransferase [Acidimicrobiia bacterium]
MELQPHSRMTRRLELRPFKKRDVEPLLEAVTGSMTALYPWLPWASHAYNRADATRFVRESMRAFRDQRAYDFAIRLRDDSDPGLHIGNVSIWYMSRGFRAGEVGYWVRSDMAGTGIATEVAARMVQVGFEELRMHRVVLRIAVGNRASERVAEKMGFTREGVLREELEVHGKWLDHTVYSLLEHEYAKRRAILQEVAGTA